MDHRAPALSPPKSGSPPRDDWREVAAAGRPWIAPPQDRGDVSSSFGRPGRARLPEESSSALAMAAVPIDEAIVSPLRRYTRALAAMSLGACLVAVAIQFYGENAESITQLEPFRSFFLHRDDAARSVKALQRMAAPLFGDPVPEEVQAPTTTPAALDPAAPSSAVTPVEKSAPLEIDEENAALPANRSLILDGVLVDETPTVVSAKAVDEPAAVAATATPDPEARTESTEGNAPESGAALPTESATKEIKASDSTAVPVVRPTITVVPRPALAQTETRDDKAKAVPTDVTGTPEVPGLEAQALASKAEATPRQGSRASKLSAATRPKESAERSSSLPARVQPSRSRKKATEATGTLSVHARPGGTVYLGGRLLGSTPLLNARVPAGRHQLALKRPGDSKPRWSSWIRVQTDKSTEINLK